MVASEIRALRRAHVERVDRAAMRATRRSCGPAGMPFPLQHLGAFLAAEGAGMRPCSGERQFGMGPRAYAAADRDSIAAGAAIARRLLAAIRRGEDAAAVRLVAPRRRVHRKDPPMNVACRPLSAMSVPALVAHHAELARALAAPGAAGDDHAAHALDARGQAVSAELGARLQAWLGAVPAADFLGAL